MNKMTEPEDTRIWKIPIRLESILELLGLELRSPDSDLSQIWMKDVDYVCSSTVIGDVRRDSGSTTFRIFYDPEDYVKINYALRLRNFLDSSGIPYQESPSREWMVEKLNEFIEEIKGGPE